MSKETTDMEYPSPQQHMVGLPRASDIEKLGGWTLSHDFVDQLARKAEEETTYPCTMEVAEHIALAVADILGSSQPPQHQELSPEDTAIATCEACGKHIQEGEPYLWGPETSFCGDCAPTYQALLDEPEGFVTADGDPLTPEQCRAWYDEHIAAGGNATESMAKGDRSVSTPAPQQQMNAREAFDEWCKDRDLIRASLRDAFEAGFAAAPPQSRTMGIPTSTQEQEGSDE